MRHSLFVLLALLDADLIRAALRHADISITKAALWMEMDRTLLERQLDGEGHLSHKRLLMLPLKFWQWLWVEYGARYGPPRELKRGVPLVLAMAARKRMLKVTYMTRRQLAARKETA